MMFLSFCFYSSLCDDSFELITCARENICGPSILPAMCWLLCVHLQMTGKDKDYRYMATSDLLNELNKPSFKADADLEIKLSNIIIQQLDDAAGDVSGLAVKWYWTCCCIPVLLDQRCSCLAT